jgi:glycosyltransferase involved in cell wall biosynthesis
MTPLPRRAHRIARRVAAPIRTRLAHARSLRALGTALRDALPLLPRHPRLALALARLDLRDPRDAGALPLVDRALAARPSRHLLRRRAELLATSGELSASLGAWHELERRGERGAAARARFIEGRLVETDTAWLPELPGPAERLEPESRTRVLHVLKSAAPERWSGFTIRTLQNLRAARGTGLEPLVVTKIGWPREVGARDIQRSVTFEGFEQHYLDRGPDYEPRSLPADVALRDVAEDLLPVVRELRPAILHVHSGHRGGELVLPALALRRRLGIPVVYEVRGVFESSWTADTRYAERAELYHRRLAQETRLLNDVDGILAISEALVDEFVARGIPAEKVGLLPNGIDPAAFDIQDPDPDLRASLGLADRLVVGYVGNLDHWREGIDVLLRALAKLGTRGRSDVAGLIVGEGTRRTELQALAGRLGLGARCVFTGRVPHTSVAQYYAQMDLFVNPRVDERAARLITPLKPYEAMALGRPVLVSDLPALREIVDPPHRGVVAPAGDATALASAIEALLDDPAKRQRLGSIGRDWVRRERTWASNGPRLRAAYERIIGPLP